MAKLKNYEYKLKAGSTLIGNAGGLLFNSEAPDCEECGGKGGHHSAGYGSIPECSKKCSCHGRKKY